MDKPVVLSVATTRQFRRRIYRYYKRNGRDLPWRKTHDPYKILISEVMLQQTQVARVIEKYKRFIRVFPNIQSLSRAPLRTIMKEWQGLGYNRRALSLKRLAQRVMKEYHGALPLNIELLSTLPGIGKATACSISAFAFNQPTVFIETNIRSVFLHHFFKNKNNVKDQEMLPLVAQALDKKNPRKWYSALMDYGVNLKETFVNPSRKSFHYKKQSRFEGSNRQIRGVIIKALTSRAKFSESLLLKRVNCEKGKLKTILDQLQREGLIVCRNHTMSLA